MLQEKLLRAIDDNQTLEIAQRITASREAAQISSQEMADFVGLSYEQYRRIERGVVLPVVRDLHHLISKSFERLRPMMNLSLIR